MNFPSPQSIGIDLGTTYSAVAYLNDRLIPMVAPVGDGSPVMPSAVFFDDDEIVVGQFALQQSKANADRLVQYIKEQIGQLWRSTFQGMEHTPETISAIIIGELVKRAAAKTGARNSAVITVPACFTERQRTSTQQAGELAGLNVLGTLNEPMAAALMFGRLFQMDAQQEPGQLTNKPLHVAVYDLGGGTFDVTLIRVTPDAMQELTTQGNRKLGGKDWDQRLFDYVADEWRRSSSADVQSDPQARQDLLFACERAKRDLGDKSHTDLRVTVAGHDCTIDVTRDKFEDLTVDLVVSTRRTLEQAMEEAGLSWSTLDRIVLVGGSTFLPAVRRMLEQAHGRKPDTRVHPMTAVAQGAAIYAHLLETGTAHRDLIQLHRHEAPPPIPPTPTVVVPSPAPMVTPPFASPPQVIRDAQSEPHPIFAAVPSGSATPAVHAPRISFVTSHGFGVVMTRGNTPQNHVLIPKNTPVPAECTRVYYTGAQTDEHTVIPIRVTQGDSEQLMLVEHLGTVLIEGLPQGETPGQEVHVTFRLDVQGHLQVLAVYANTGRVVRSTLEVAGCLRPEEFRKFRATLTQKGLV